MATVLECLNSALHRAFAEDERVYLLGEDVLDPYGGAFKATRGLSTRFPQRVLATPISEAGITGVAAGMALRGLRPVVEIMFGDFLTLAADQLINHIAKFRWMYNDQVRLPLVIRTPMGGRRGYGPTHSQTLEKLFLGVPGLRVLAASSLNDPGRLLESAILDDDDPVLFVENKLLYLLPVQNEATLEEFEMRSLPYSPTPLFPSRRIGEKGNAEAELRTGIGDGLAPAYALTVRGAPPPSITLAAYGFMAELARQAALRLAYELEIFVELVVLTQLAPYDLQPVLDSIDRTRRLLVVEEGSRTLGWGAEVVARAAEAAGPRLAAARRVAARDLPVSASGPLEADTLPDVDQIVQAAQKMASF